MGIWELMSVPCSVVGVSADEQRDPEYMYVAYYYYYFL